MSGSGQTVEKQLRIISVFTILTLYFFHLHVYQLTTQCLEFGLQLKIGIWPLTVIPLTILGADLAWHSFKVVLLMSPVKLSSSSSSSYFICCVCRVVLASPLCKFSL